MLKKSKALTLVVLFVTSFIAVGVIHGASGFDFSATYDFDDDLFTAAYASDLTNITGTITSGPDEEVRHFQIDYLLTRYATSKEGALRLAQNIDPAWMESMIGTPWEGLEPFTYYKGALVDWAEEGLISWAAVPSSANAVNSTDSDQISYVVNNLDTKDFDTDNFLAGNSSIVVQDSVGYSEAQTDVLELNEEEHEFDEEGNDFVGAGVDSIHEAQIDAIKAYVSRTNGDPFGSITISQYNVTQAYEEFDMSDELGDIIEEAMDEAIEASALYGAAFSFKDLKSKMPLKNIKTTIGKKLSAFKDSGRQYIGAAKEKFDNVVSKTRVTIGVGLKNKAKAAWSSIREKSNNVLSSVKDGLRNMKDKAGGIMGVFKGLKGSITTVILAFVVIVIALVGITAMRRRSMAS